MKRLFIFLLLMLILLTPTAAGALTNRITSITNQTGYWWNGDPQKDQGQLLLIEVQTIIEAWALDGSNDTITFANGLTIDNAVDNIMEWNENSDEVKWTFGSNKLALSSTDVLEISIGTIYLGMTEISAPSGNPSANNGWLYLKDDAATTKLYFEDSAGTVTDILASASGNTLNAAYDQGGAGAGRTITADTGAFALTNTDADTAFLMTINAAPGTAAALGGIEITVGGNSTEAAIEFENTGSGPDLLGTAGWNITKAGVATFSNLVTSLISSTGTTTLGDGTGTVAVNSSVWDITTAGAMSGITTLGMSGDLTISAGDVILANGKVVKGSITNAETVGMSAYDVDGAGYVGTFTLTNGNTIAAALGTGVETLAINTTTWDVSTTGAISGLASVTVSSATPVININDSDATDGDDNVILTAAATDTGSGSEDVDFTIAQQIAGTSRVVGTFDADGNITLGFGTQDVVATADITVTGSDLTLGVAGVKLTGDGDGAITMLGLGDGEDEDLTLNLDDTADTGVYSSSTGLAKLTYTGITLDTDQLEVTAASPLIEFFDTDAAAGDVNAKITIAATDTGDGTEDIDVTFTQQVAGSDVDFLTSDADGNLTINSGAGTINMTDNVVFNGGQTRKQFFTPKEAELDGTAPATLADIGTDGQTNVSTLTFDADGGATGDDIVYIMWRVPDGYVTDSARLNIAYSFSTAEDAADEAQFDFTVNAVAQNEAIDAAGTALANQTTVIADASADNGNIHTSQYNIEVEDIVIDDYVIIQIAVDESASALTASGTLDVHYFELEWESTE